MRRSGELRSVVRRPQAELWCVCAVLGACATLACGKQDKGPGTGGTAQAGGAAGEAGSDNPAATSSGAGGSRNNTTSGGNGGTQASGGTASSTDTGSGSGGTSQVTCDPNRDNACSVPGATCENNVLKGCVPDEDGCLVSLEQDCGDDLCDHLRLTPTCSPPGGLTGDSCDAKQFLTLPASVQGEVFNDSYSDRQTFEGDNCSIATVAAAEAVFVVDVPAGETLSVSEVAQLTSQALSIDAVFGIMAGCSDDAACLASGGADDRGGISYTATEDETVAVWVSANSAFDGSYDIRFEVPETLGSLAANEQLPAVVGGPLTDAEWETYVVHTQATTVFGGTASGAVNVSIYDALGSLMLTSNTLPYFARILEPGTYRLLIDAVGDISDYGLELFTIPPVDLGNFAVGGSFDQELPAITAGDWRYYRFELSESARADITLASTSGDPDIWLYSSDGQVLDAAEAFGGNEALATDALPAGEYLIGVLAFEASGDIASHTLAVDFLAP